MEKKKVSWKRKYRNEIDKEIENIEKEKMEMKSENIRYFERKKIQGKQKVLSKREDRNEADNEVESILTKENRNEVNKKIE